MEDIIKGKEIKTSPEPVSLKGTEKILDQMNNCVCRIFNNGKGTGFFTKIPYKSKLLPVLITNNHVLDENAISINKTIEFSLDNETFFYKIIIDNSRKTFTNKDYDITIIELKTNDGLSYDSFLDIDDNIKDNDLNEIYKNKTIYIIHYPLGQDAKCSLGTVKCISVNKLTIEHYCATDNGSSGSPLINLFNYKVIGVYKGSPDKKKYNIGTILTKPIQEFIIMYQKDQNAINNLCQNNNNEMLQNNQNNQNNQNKISQDKGNTQLQQKDNSKIIKKHNNIIYFDDNIDYLDSIYKDSNYFEKNTPGVFILCTNIESLSLIEKEILYKNENEKDIIFNLITNGKGCEKIMNYLDYNDHFNQCIQNVCIYCSDKNKYESLKNWFS